MARRPRPFSGTRALARKANVPAASLAQLAEPVATTRDGRDITRPFVRGLQQPRDPVLMTAIDWGVYDDILKDSQVASCLQQRRNAVVSRNWDVIPGDDEDPRSVAAAEALKDILLQIGWDRVTDKMLYATFYGYSVAEVMWKPTELFGIDAIRVRHARRFRYDSEDRLRLLTPADQLGEIMPPRKFWVVTAGASDDDEPYGRGLAEWLYWPTLFKRNGLRFWNNFLDKFSSPTAIGKYPAGTPETQINNLVSALQAIATDTGIAVPERMAIELLQVARSGVADYEQLCRYMDEAITKVVLSQTMTTDNGSSHAQGQVHAGVKLEVVKADADLLTDSFTDGPARWFTDFNFGADVAAPRVMRDVEEEIDTQRSAETDNTLKSQGWVRTEESFQDTYGDGYERASEAQSDIGSDEDQLRKIELPADAEEAKTIDVAQFAADDPRPLYVYRQLRNADKLIAWANAQGLKSTLPAADMHVTIAYSKRPVNWFKMGDDWGYYRDPLTVKAGGPRLVDRLGNEGAIVLHFYDGYLDSRHRQMCEAGASWDFKSYLPHVTLTYDAGDIDLSKVEPFTGELLFGPEIFEPLDEDWKARIVEASFAETIDDFADDDETEELVNHLVDADRDRISAQMTGSLIERIADATSADELSEILNENSLELMNDLPLRESLQRAAFAMRLAEENRGAP